MDVNAPRVVVVNDEVEAEVEVGVGVEVGVEVEVEVEVRVDRAGVVNRRRSSVFGVIHYEEADAPAVERCVNT